MMRAETFVMVYLQGDSHHAKLTDTTRCRF